jgi:acyl dehydratase
MPRHFADLSEGDSFAFREYTITEEQIKKYAKQFDPQSFHLERGGANDSVFDDIVASGWHTASISMRLLVDSVFSNVAVMGGRGVNHLRWHKPVYAEDTLSGEAIVVAKSVDDQHPGRGEVRFDVEIKNQQGTTVMSYTSLTLVRRRGG